MPFDTLSDRLKIVAQGCLAKCREEWGNNGLKTECSIDTRIGWRPTFYLKPHKALVAAVEVNDVIYPEILKIAAHDVEHFEVPISIYQACSLDVYQADSRLTKVNLLRAHGFGLVTVDDSGKAVIQFRAPPLAQHIPPDRLVAALATLTSRLKVKFRSAYSTYETNIVQGLQEAAQIIEALINSLATQAESAGKIPVGSSRRDAADIVDILYGIPMFHNYRAALGGARSFFRNYRNPPSHPARNAKEAADKIRSCRAGFFESLRMAEELRTVIQRVGYRITIQ